MSTQLLCGKICAITGGVTGIGRAIALEYIAQGACVAVNHLGDSSSSSHFQSMRLEAAQALPKDEEVDKRLIEVPGDISDQATAVRLVARTVEVWGGLDVFVSNAGICEFAEFLE
ncbi:NAD(P)-binding protein [Lepidopterella palustris CBS 459.81]|uniref:NAD(P)-binding protein n=1 Tax=Lepidopterella palustris CBS 459.81 TaxID=1314670 RepID=A0A8E2J7G8_9PEZI|nr:NAD(P)-binding protein [Lepidopterella palustris CBS 459.81]